MADKFDSKIVSSLSTLWDGVKYMGSAGGNAAKGGGNGAVKVGKGIGKTADTIVGTPLQKTGQFMTKHPEIALIALAALAFKPIKNFFGGRKEKKMHAALQAEAGQLSIAEQTLARRQQAAAASADLGQFNPADGNAVNRVQGGRGVPTPHF